MRTATALLSPLFLAAGLLLGAPSAAQGTGSPVPVTRFLELGTIIPGVATEPLFHDRILGRFLADRGWALREHPFDTGLELLAYRDGPLDLSVVGEAAAFGALDRTDLGFYATGSLSFDSLVVTRPILPAQLKGLRIGYPPGTAAQVTLELVLRASGLRLTDVAAVPMDPRNMVQALASRRVDAVSVWEPVTTQVLTQVPGTMVLSKSEFSTLVTGDRKFAAREPEVFSAVLAAFLRSVRWEEADPKNLPAALNWVQDTVVRRSGKPVAGTGVKWDTVVRRDTFDAPSFPLLPLDIRNPDGTDARLFRQLQESGMVPPGLSWAEAAGRFDLEALPRLVAAGDRWQTGRFDYSPQRLEGGTAR